MTTSDTAAALASALPVSIWDNQSLAEHQADRLAEQGWVLLRPDDEATVERMATAMLRSDAERYGVVASDVAYDRQARAALAALAARPGDADTEQAEVDHG